MHAKDFGETLRQLNPYGYRALTQHMKAAWMSYLEGVPPEKFFVVQELFQELLQVQEAPNTTAPTEISVEKLDLSVRLFNVLKAAKIETLGQLSQLSVKEFMDLRNTGKRQLIEAEEHLASYGMRFRRDS